MENYYVFIGGSRDIKDVSAVKQMILEDLTRISQEKSNKEMVLIHGGARGVDEYAAEVAYELGYEIEVFEADWDGQGVTAGHKRNGDMAEKANECLFYWDGRSKGTDNAIYESKIRGRKTTISIVF